MNILQEAITFMQKFIILLTKEELKYIENPDFECFILSENLSADFKKNFALKAKEKIVLAQNLKDMTDFMEISKLNSEIQSLKSRLIRLEKSIDRNSFTFAITSFTDDTAPFFIIHLMDGFIGIAHQKDSKEDSKNVKDARKD